MSRRAALVALLLSGALAACVPDPVIRGASSPGAALAWRDRQRQLVAINAFTLQGRVAETGLSASRADLRWQQSGARYDVQLSGPLGVGALALRGDGHATEIRSKDGVIVTEQPEAYMVERLGWSLPLARLRWWVLGVPAPDAAHRPELLIDDAGRLLQLREDGWTIVYDEYRGDDAQARPRRLSLDDGEHRFRLVIDRWD